MLKKKMTLLKKYQKENGGRIVTMNGEPAVALTITGISGQLVTKYVFVTDIDPFFYQ